MRYIDNISQIRNFQFDFNIEIKINSTYGEFNEELNMTKNDESNMTLYGWTLYDWWNFSSETIDDGCNETNMTSYGENLGVKDYEIVDFYDRNATVSDFS